MLTYSDAYRILCGTYGIWRHTVHPPKVILLAQQSSWWRVGKLEIQLDWRSQSSVDTFSAQFVSRFKLLGTDASEMTVAARPIVERIDVVGHVG